MTAAGEGGGMDVHCRDVAAIFTDIAGFTSLVEAAAPEVLGTRCRTNIGRRGTWYRLFLNHRAEVSCALAGPDTEIE